MPHESQETTSILDTRGENCLPFVSCLGMGTPLAPVACVSSYGTAGYQGEGCYGRASGPYAASALGLCVAAIWTGSQHFVPSQVARSICY